MQVCADFDCCLAIVKILHSREFWGVDKLKSAADFCNRPLALYLEQHSVFWDSLADDSTR